MSEHPVANSEDSKERKPWREPVESTTAPTSPGELLPTPRSSGRRFSPEDKEDIVRRYSTGETANAIAESMNASVGGVTFVLRGRGVLIRNNVTSPEIQSQAVELYRSGLTAEAVEERLGISQGAVFTALRRAGIEKRPYFGGGVREHKHQFNEDFFNHIDNENVAYVLGFLTADGCIGDRFVDVHLKESDELHVRSLANAMDYDGPIKNVTVSSSKGGLYPAVGFRVWSKKMADRLHSLGLVERKSLVVKPCTEVPKDLLRHYWRGVFDGDGSIYAIPERVPRPAGWGMNLIGTFEIVNAFREFVSNHTDSIAGVHPQSSSQVYRIDYMGLYHQKIICHLLYDGATIFLPRKKALSDQIIVEADRDHRAKTVTGWEKKNRPMSEEEMARLKALAASYPDPPARPEAVAVPSLPSPGASTR